MKISKVSRSEGQPDRLPLWVRSVVSGSQPVPCDQQPVISTMPSTAMPRLTRYGIVFADVQDAIQTAFGGRAVIEVLQGVARYDVVVRYLPQYRDTQDAIDRIRLLAPSGERVSLTQLTTVKAKTGGDLSRGWPALRCQSNTAFATATSAPQSKRPSKR